jgi:cobalamin-dependent methionine synthase I
MPFKPNYRQQRNERARTKAMKQQEKLQRRREKAVARKSSHDEPQVPSSVGDASLPDGDQ